MRSAKAPLVFMALPSADSFAREGPGKAITKSAAVTIAKYPYETFERERNGRFNRPFTQ